MHTLVKDLVRPGAGAVAPRGGPVGALLLLVSFAAPIDAQDFVFPSGLTFAPDGSLIMADRGAHYVFRIDPETGRTEAIVGTGVSGFAGDGGPASEAVVSAPEWVEFDPDGNLILADRANHRVRLIEAETGVIRTIVGTGREESTGDGGPATEASITNPFGLELDAAGNLFIWDTEAHRIRRVDAETGVITTVVGTGEQGFSGDGGPGTRATMFRPHNGRFDADGRLVFGDSFNQRIRRWDPESGVIETIAGIGEQGSSPHGTPANDAMFMYFGAMVFEPDGDLVFTSLDARILRIDADTWTLDVVAGTGENGYSGDGGPALEAELQTPYGLARGPDGDLYFSDASNGAVRVIDGATGVIRTLSTGVAR
ncbi:MAG: hypothetical protein R3195_05510 [Gemmatimonadota bacterium]|nr:hypothetical protein [Gemmatimonadota bacterium]